MLQGFFRRRQDRRRTAELYRRIVEQARRPAFYLDLGVPDTLDGRFDMVALHVFLVNHRLKDAGPEADETARRVMEHMIDDFDESLREMGAGDTGIGRRVKAMLRGVNGRLMAYDQALAAGGGAALEVALDNNLYGTVDPSDPAHLAAMAAYVTACRDALAARPLESVLAGDPGFPPPNPPSGDPRP